MFSLRPRPPSEPPPRPRVPDGMRVYAIGDIHGCDALFARLLDRIDADHARHPPKRQVIVLLGDLVDRGPNSAAVVERVVQLADAGRDVRLIAGNHEEMLVGACAGDPGMLTLFARNGGRETALSYGIAAASWDNAGPSTRAQLLAAAVPATHHALIAGAARAIMLGGYAFVHAGIRPGIPLAQQRGADLRWIRGPFLHHRGHHEKFIVHGHTISPTVDERSNRLGIDTGAYATGRLTAVALDEDRRWFLQT